MSSTVVTATLRASMFEAARRAQARAYAPYSRFSVGAAVLDEQLRIHAGCNVENAAYPEGVCAEAGAISAMIVAGGTRILAVAIVGAGAASITPCGGCRQKLREFGDPDMPVFVGDLAAQHASFTLLELLPHNFGPEHL